MLIDRVLADLDLPDPDERRGNPIRGSRLGRCARQSAMMLFPEAFPSDPLPARAKLVFAFGHMIHDLIRKEFRRVLRGEWGMEEDRFHFAVPLTVKDAEACAELFRTGALMGIVEDGGLATSYWRDADGDLRMNPATRPDHKRGLWLNLAEPMLYVPLHVDGIAATPDGSLATVEIKSMASGGFLHALKGRVGYEYRAQMACAVDGTGLDTQIMVSVRKDTSHILEAVYTKRAESVTIRYTKQSQLLASLVQAQGGEGFIADTAPAGDQDIREWEAVEVSHPFEPHLLEQARERVRRILRATPTNLPEREYGPSFSCLTCEGTGTQTKNKATGEPLKRGAKVCNDCEGAKQLADAEAPWQCRYCPSFRACWSEAKPRLEFDDAGKPHWWFMRANVEAAGLTYTSPE